ncbi:MAG: hypothetical protein UU73_C0006G0026 [Candidatus Daviesbacteria bacterium GW2011_GWA1_41_61]|uniref:Uncharacterized protein n=1 Tax=Candidatus Daviesbacteria bacterium GW2011_GWA2_40_9 TaxID=1618424 RepID=A0A0G0TZV2_9BACT|nr:MAG: hypothetical protein UU26_C0030G0016 [Candidatus Daviesbacteria bacterium GW2011_GWC1_40_9]KKR82429.1 MAG: hypothetical protein UU29_C0013G0017 [Candidatus Daviesbacteria bacterium GW2011_GWA2_40_9]KKR92375.1 MAG: hypothetical protein UU44_C0006G0026 [Candidatus Daviesbacteria bacterium GW2011_GWB1_41_15]KKS14563.1 MAG: hypothetical protein UU73_C0006G0026 [Candidatus Daviesbacteria bacterium GW2011_GWA1_41_61]
MVVIGIIAGLVILILPKLTNFQGYQVLSNSADQMQSYLRVAQNNALSGAKCKKGSADRAKKWILKILNDREYQVESECSDGSFGLAANYSLSEKTKVLQADFLDAADNRLCTASSSAMSGTAASFDNISGSPNFGNVFCASSLANAAKMVLTLQGEITTIAVVMDKGGGIYTSSFLAAAFVPPAPPLPTPTTTPTTAPTPTLTPTPISTSVTVYAGAAVDDSSNGGTLSAWANPSFAVGVSDASRATVTSSGTAISHYLKATNFGFAIPSTATINGIMVEIQKLSSGGTKGSVIDNRVSLIKGSVVTGVNYGTAANWPTSEGYTTYGSSVDLWSNSWTPADINDPNNFGVVLAAAGKVAGGTADRTANVNTFRITVYYTYTP